MTRFAATLLAIAFAAAPSLALAQQQTATVVTSANVRAAPDKTAAVMGTVQAGAVVNVRCELRWCQLDNGGWVFEDLLSIGGAPAAGASTPVTTALPDAAAPIELEPAPVQQPVAEPVPPVETATAEPESLAQPEPLAEPQPLAEPAPIAVEPLAPAAQVIDETTAAIGPPDFAGRWRLTLPDGSTGSLTLQQQDISVSGTVEAGGTSVAFTGEASGSRATAVVPQAGSLVDLVLLGSGSAIAINVAGNPPIVATGIRAGDGEITTGSTSTTAEPTAAAPNFEGLWRVGKADATSTVIVFQNGDSVKGAWGNFRFEGRIADGHLTATVSTVGEDGSVTPSNQTFELVLISDGTLVVNVIADGTIQNVVAGVRVIG